MSMVNFEIWSIVSVVVWVLSTSQAQTQGLECYNFKCVLTREGTCHPSSGKEYLKTCSPGEVCYQWVDSDTGQVTLAGCDRNSHVGTCKLVGPVYDCQCSNNECNSIEDPMWIDSNPNPDADEISASPNAGQEIQPQLPPSTTQPPMQNPPNGPQSTKYKHDFSHNQLVQQGNAHETPGFRQNSHFLQQTNVKSSQQVAFSNQYTPGTLQTAQNNPGTFQETQNTPGALQTKPNTPGSFPATPIHGTSTLTCAACSTPLCYEFKPIKCKSGEVCLQKLSLEGAILALKCGPIDFLGCTMQEKINKIGARLLNYRKCSCNTDFCNSVPLHSEQG